MARILGMSLFLGLGASGVGMAANADTADASTQYPCGFTGERDSGAINSFLDSVLGTDGPPYPEGVYHNCESSTVQVRVDRSAQNETACVSPGQTRFTTDPALGAVNNVVRIGSC